MINLLYFLSRSIRDCYFILFSWVGGKRGLLLLVHSRFLLLLRYTCVTTNRHRFLLMLSESLLCRFCSIKGAGHHAN